MAVQSENSSIQYDGNNSAVNTYQVPFPFFKNSDLVVVKTLAATGAETTLVLNTDYTVSGAGNDAGGSLRTTVAIPSTYKVTIYREIVATQPLQYEEADDFPAASHEQGLDRLTFLSQQNSRKLTAGFRLRESDGGVTSFAKVANALVGIDADGTAKMFTGAMIQALLNLPQTVLDQPTKTFSNAAARAAATPDFLGQVGVQLDTVSVYVGTSIAAGGWTVYDFTLAADSVGTTQVQNSAITPAKLAGALDLSGKTVTLPAGSVLASMLAATLDLSGKTVTLPFSAFPNGTVLQTVCVSTTARMTIGGIPVPFTDYAPLITQGGEVLSLNITPRLATSKILLTASGLINHSTGNPCCAFICKAGVNEALAVGQNYLATYVPNTHIIYQDSLSSTAPLTYSLRAGSSAAGTLVNNIYSYPDKYGSKSNTVLIAQEIKA